MIGDNKLPPSAKGLIVPTRQTSPFYLLRKIHKPGNPGKPIASVCCCPTENIASYLDQIMCPLVRNLGTYVKDTNHALRIFNDFHFDNTTTGERFLYTMDIKSLYTVIPNNSGLEALAYFLNKRPVLDPPTSTLTRLAELMMTLNAFTFNGDFYQQIGGVAMGSKMGPSYACLFVGYVEERIATSTTQEVHRSMTSSESHVVAAWTWRTIFASYPTFILLFNLRTQSLTLNSLSSISRYALLMITSALPFTTRTLTPTPIFIISPHIPAIARKVFLAVKANLSSVF